MPYIEKQVPHPSEKSDGFLSRLYRLVYKERFLDAIMGSLVWSAFILCLILAVYAPVPLLILSAALAIYTAIRFVSAVLAAAYGLRLIRTWEKTDWRALYQKTSLDKFLAWDEVYHLVVIPNYNEALSILNKSLERLAEQPDAATHMMIVMAMEAREKDSLQKANALKAQYGTRFARFFVAVHPADLPGEIASKSANQTWALKQTWQELAAEGWSMDQIVLTTMDADTLWHPNHFSALTWQFLTREDRYNCLWQAPIRYQANVWQLNPMMRLLNAVASGFELAAAAAPWWITVPISSYSLSLKLLIDTGYWDTDVISDEYHLLIKSYFVREGQLQLVPVMLPFLATSPVGRTLWESCRLRYEQTVRHAWATKETGYMIAQMMEHPHLLTWRTWRILFRLAHDVLLAGAGWVTITLGIQIPFLLHPALLPPIDALLAQPTIILNYPILLILTGVGLVVLVGSMLMWAQDMSQRPPRPAPWHWREILWKIIAIPMLPVLTLIFLALPTLVAQTRLMLGHEMAFKVTRKD